MKYLLAAVIVFAVVAGVWYLVAAPDAARAMPGSISGTLSYPSEGTPAMRVCAEPVAGGEERCVTTQDAPPAPNTFRIVGVPPGDYRVYAMLVDPESLGVADSEIARMKAYYSAFVTCGYSSTCRDHTPIIVTVTAGAESTGVKPSDWYR